MRAATILLVAGLIGLTSCDVRVYEVQLTPNDGKLDRELTGYFRHRQQGQPDTPLSDAELQHLAKQYGLKSPPSGGPRHKFTGSFKNRMPQDIGGSGNYVEWPSEFGVARVYIERFRGDDDLVDALDERRKAVNRWVDLLVGWVDVEWADQPERVTIRRFLDQQLRRDLVNVSYYLKTFALAPGRDDVTSDDPAQEANQPSIECLMRVGQYLVERQYFQLEELPKWVHAFATAPGMEQESEFLDLAQTVVRRKLGVAPDAPLPPSLAILTDPVRLSASLNDYLRTSEEYVVKHAEWLQTPLDTRSEVPPEPTVVLSDLASKFIGFSALFLGHQSELRLTLHASRKPTATNGIWDSDRGVVEWKKWLASSVDDSDTVPTIAYAIWAQPDSAQQTRRFGKAVLDGDKLITFCVWRAGLTPAETTQWEKFVVTLKPGEKLVEQIEAFRFEGEPEDPDESCRSSAVRDLLELLK